MLRAPADAMQAVERWLAPRLGQRRLLTITLRQHAYLPDRNSNIDAWSGFGRTAAAAGYFPVVIPDTEQVAPLPRPKRSTARLYLPDRLEYLACAARFTSAPISISASTTDPWACAGSTGARAI